MDRERDRDATEALIEEHDEKAGGGEPERVRPGQGDPGQRSVDQQKPPPDEGRPAEPDPSAGDDPGPFTPRGPA